MKKRGRKQLERDDINLARVLRSQNLSLNKAAKLLGVNRQTVFNWVQDGVPKNALDKLTIFSKEECPFGHRLGIDIDRFDECSTSCEVDETCYKIYDAWYD